MGLNPSATVTVSLKDRSGEPTSYSVPTTVANAAEGEGNTEFDALIPTIGALIDGIVTRYNFNQTFRVSNAKNSTSGQREEKFLVTYEDTVTKIPYSFELPCRKSSLIPPVRDDEYDITASPFAAFCTAFEAYATSPDGNAVNVTSIRLIGKNT